MNIPNTYTNTNETGCCAVPNIKAWQDQKIIFEDKIFIRLYTRSIFYIPINMGRVIKKLNKIASDAKAMPSDQDVMILSHEKSPWKAEQLFYVTNPIDGADNITIDGEFLSKVFEGPYKKAGEWYKTMQDYVVDSGYQTKDLYYFYTTCPKCAKHYGKNYVIVLAKIA